MPKKPTETTALEDIRAKIEETKQEMAERDQVIEAAQELNELNKKANQQIDMLNRLAICADDTDVDWLMVYKTQSHRFNKGGTPLEILHLLIAGKIETNDKNCLTPADVRDQLIALGYHKYAAFNNNQGYALVYGALRKIGAMAGMQWMNAIRVGIYI